MQTQIRTSEFVTTANKVAHDNHWRFQVLEEIGMISKPEYKDGWWISPADHIPPDAQDRIHKLKKAGVPIQGVLIAHEAPRLFPAPAKRPRTYSQDLKDSIYLRYASQAFWWLTEHLVEVLQGFRAWAIDPALIVVLEDGTWLSSSWKVFIPTVRE